MIYIIEISKEFGALIWTAKDEEDATETILVDGQYIIDTFDEYMEYIAQGLEHQYVFKSDNEARDALKNDNLWTVEHGESARKMLMRQLVMSGVN